MLKAFFIQQFEDFKIQIQSLKEEMRSELRDMRGEFSTITSSVDFFSDRMDSFEAKLTSYDAKLAQVDSLGQRVSVLEATVHSMQRENNEKEQQMRLYNVEITGVPESKDEKVTAIVTTIAKHLGVSILSADIDYASRITPRTRNANRPRAIVAKFCRRQLKDVLISAARKKAGGIKAGDVGLASSSTAMAAIYINEHLTVTNKDLLYKARNLVRERGFQYLWVRNGHILVRRKDGAPPLRINCADDLKKIV